MWGCDVTSCVNDPGRQPGQRLSGVKLTSCVQTLLLPSSLPPKGQRALCTLSITQLYVPSGSDLCAG